MLNAEYITVVNANWFYMVPLSVHPTFKYLCTKKPISFIASVIHHRNTCKRGTSRHLTVLYGTRIFTVFNLLKDK